ncbi:hypothetical protein DFH28DRAFT_980183 [Melampsora americana]|nr:hypothetical protein DFH28DRAFT_980183 [Melampsora americana]
MGLQYTEKENYQNIQASTITSCPTPPCVLPVPTVLEITSSSSNLNGGGGLNLRDTGCAIMFPEKHKSILQHDPEESILEGPSNELHLPLSTASLLSGSSDRKSRRKMVIRPASCNMFWDQIQGTTSEDCAAKASNPEWNLTHDPSSAIKSAYFDSFTAQSETPLTTPGSNGILSGTETRQDQFLSGHFPSLDAMRLSKQMALRPAITRSESLPATTNSLPETSRVILDAGKGFESLMGSVLMGNESLDVEKPNSEVKFFDPLERFDVPSATDVVRFGRAVTEALELHLNGLREYKKEVERVGESYWSDSESEISDDED